VGGTATPPLVKDVLVKDVLIEAPSMANAPVAVMAAD
jgi:hypothetical protein